MSDGMFRRVGRMRSGYDPAEVDEFFAHARSVYETGPAGAMTGEDVRRVVFDVVRGGYATTAVDAALDRLEAAFVAKTRAEHVATRGSQSWLTHLSERARTLYPRLTRPSGQRFAPPRGRHAGYDVDEVDALCDRLVRYFDTGAPLTAHELRTVTFRARRGRRAYAEGPVDAFMERAVDVLLGAE